MRQGVYESDLFVLFLTNSVLSRTFCQKELAWAIEFEKPIVVVVEEEQRFWPFDYERWSRDMCNKTANLRGESLRCGSLSSHSTSPPHPPPILLPWQTRTRSSSGKKACRKVAVISKSVQAISWSGL